MRDGVAHRLSLSRLMTVTFSMQIKLVFTDLPWVYSSPPAGLHWLMMSRRCDRPFSALMLTLPSHTPSDAHTDTHAPCRDLPGTQHHSVPASLSQQKLKDYKLDFNFCRICKWIPWQKNEMLFKHHQLPC